MKTGKVVAVALCLMLTLGVAVLHAQSGSSNKAFFAKDDDGVTLGAFDQTCMGQYAGHGSLCSEVITVFDIEDALRTSNVGAVELRVSLECAVMTYSEVSSRGPKTVSSRAGIQIFAAIDGIASQPSPVIFCDRLQAVGLDVQLTCECEVPDTTCTCTVDDDITLELFQSTKSAATFNFFDAPLLNDLHDILITAQGIVVCTEDGETVDCSNGVVNEFEDAGTTAAIGKATLVAEEHNNWGSQ